jgi:MFS family permease
VTSYDPGQAPDGGYGQAPGYGPAPAYGQEPGYGRPAMRHGGGMATAALVLGILALVLCWTVFGGIVLGLVAVVLGIIAARWASRGEAPGRGRAIAGIVTGAIGLVIAVALVAIGASFLNSTSGKNYQQCLQQAGSDQAAQQQCATEFQKSISGG